MTRNKRTEKILVGLVFIGLLSVLGAFFVVHQMNATCVFNVSANCPALLGTMGETLHLLEIFGEYVGGVVVMPFVLLMAAALTLVYLARDAISGFFQRCLFIYRELEGHYASARSFLLFTIGLQNKRATRLLFIVRGA